MNKLPTHNDERKPIQPELIIGEGNDVGNTANMVLFMKNGRGVAHNSKAYRILVGLVGGVKLHVLKTTEEAQVLKKMLLPKNPDGEAVYTYLNQLVLKYAGPELLHRIVHENPELLELLVAKVNEPKSVTAEPVAV